MIKEAIEAYKAAREENREYRKEVRAIDIRERYVKLQGAAAKVVADMKKLGVSSAEVKDVLKKPWED